MDIETATKDLEAIVKAGEGDGKKEPDIKAELAKAADDLEGMAEMMDCPKCEKKMPMGGKCQHCGYKMKGYEEEKNSAGRPAGEAPGEDPNETSEDEGTGEGPGGMLVSRKRREKGKGKGDHDMTADGDEYTPEEHRSRRGGDSLANRSMAEQVKDGFYKALTEDGETVELLEAGPALAHLASVMAKSMADLADAIADRFDKSERAWAVGLRSQRLLHKAVEGIQVKAPSPGVIGVVGVEQKDNGKPSRPEIMTRLEKAVNDGKLDPVHLSRFSSAGDAALAFIPEDVAKSYGIPK